MTNQKNEKVATRGQRRKIRAMLDGDLISFEMAQAIWERRVRTMTMDEVRIARWDEAFPGLGEELMLILRPFYDWKPELKPAHPDLESVAKGAVFWRDVKHVFPISACSISEYKELISPDCAIAPDSYRRRVPELFEKCWDLFMSELGEAPFRGHEYRQPPWDLSWHMTKSSLFIETVSLVLVAACMERILNKRTINQPLQLMLHLFITGNYSFAFDDQESLLVQVA